MNLCQSVKLAVTDEEVKNIEAATRQQASSILWFSLINIYL
jgi:hypothetical protein